MTPAERAREIVEGSVHRVSPPCDCYIRGQERDPVCVESENAIIAEIAAALAAALEFKCHWCGRGPEWSAK